MAGVTVDVHAEDGLEIALPAAQLERAVRMVLAAEGVDAAELSLTLLGDPAIERLNREYLEHEGPTDVISFPLSGPAQAILGDVYVGAAQAARQAVELGVPVAEELLRLAIHGTLHVLGYEHPDGEGREASEMYRRQEQLLGEVLATGAEEGR